MKVSTKNEYGKLKSVIIGRIAGGCWPKDDLFFNRMMELSTYTKSKLKRGKIPNDIVEIQAIPDSNDVIGVTDLYLNLNIPDSSINMVKDTISSGEQISGIGFKVTSSHTNGELIRE